MPPHLKERLKIARRILTARDPYIVISKKPPEMVEARGPDYRFGTIGRLIDTQMAASALRARIDADAETLRETAVSVARELQSSFFPEEDAALLYRLVRTAKPRRIVEIGSGNSTRIMRRAIADGALSTHVTAIDPAPRADIEGYADTIVRRSVVGIGSETFADIAPGDMFFVDGSHYIFNGTDATFLFLEVLPDLPPGTLVHVHDLCLPFEYNALFTERSYNEQYVVAALLLGGSKLAVDLPVYYRHSLGLGGPGLSFWMTVR